MPRRVYRKSDTEKGKFNQRWDLKEETGCWIWNATTIPSGHGRYGINGVNTTASRASWIIHRGDPGDLHVCHNCPGGDNPACVNPDHLWLGTNKDNQQDSWEKGRIHSQQGKKQSDETIQKRQETTNSRYDSRGNQHRPYA